LFEGDNDLRDVPLSDRKDRLSALLSKAGDDRRLRFVEHFETGGDAVLKSACKLSLEGIVSKKADSTYGPAAQKHGRSPSAGQGTKS
jgi:bifunctional non-homologous end joining protein LigD